MSADIFVPTSNPEDALVSALHTITYVTADPQGLERMLSQGMDLECSAWVEPSEAERKSLNPYFGFAPEDRWQTCTFYRRGDVANIQIRAICVTEDKPMTRPEIDGRYFGGATIGFPMFNIAEREKTMASAGIESSVGLKELEFTNAEGQTYVSSEIHFLGTENIFIMGVQRPDIFIQVGTIDPDTDIGAPAYSARCVKGLEEVKQFFDQVLGYEIRRDMAMTVGPNSGLRLAEGMPERFVQGFAPGSSSGYVVFMEHGGMGIPTPAPSVGPPNRGVVMWSFATNSFDEVYARAQAAGRNFERATNP